MADVTDVPGAPVTEDDEFVLLGEQGSERITAHELASACGTISYEIVTGMSRRAGAGVPCRRFRFGSADAHGWEIRMTRIELWNGDICDLEVDAIVSPAATSLWMSTGVAGELKRAGGDAIEFAAVRQAPAATRRRHRDSRRPARRQGRHPRRLPRARSPDERPRHRPRRPQRHGARPRAGALERGLPGPRHRDRRVPAGRGRPHRGGGHSRRAGGARRRSSTSSSPCAVPPPTRPSRAPSRTTSRRRPGRCSSRMRCAPSVPACAATPAQGRQAVSAAVGSA